MRSASGMNSLHSRITSGVQRSAASDACAAAGLAPAAAITIARKADAAHSSSRDRMFDVFVTLVLCLMIFEANSIAQYFAEIGSSSAGNKLITRWPLSVTTTSSSMRAAE